MPPSRKPRPATDSGKSLPNLPDPVEFSTRTAEQLGARVAEARRRGGLTLAGVAARTGLSPAYLSQIESGAANPTVRALARLAAAFDTDVATLFGSARPEAVRFAPYWSPAARATTVDGRPGVWDLTADGSRRLNARLVHGDPADHAAPVAHPGEELVVVLRGHCRLHVDGVGRAMTAGDACHYPATRPHHISAASADLTLSVVMSEHGTMGG